jgi:hypothetical protein
MFHHFRNGVTLFDLETANQTTRIDNSSRVRLNAFARLLSYLSSKIDDSQDKLI